MPRRLRGWLVAAAALVAIGVLPLGAPSPTGAQNGTPSADASPVAGETIGLTRAAPAAIGQETIGGGYGVTVLEVRTEPSEPPIENAELVLVRVRARNTTDNDAPIQIGPGNFGMTSTGYRLDPAQPGPGPAPMLDGQLFANGETEGWLVLFGLKGETDRELVVLPGAGTDSALVRYLALEDGASIGPAFEASAAGPNATPSAVGLTQNAPVPVDQVGCNANFGFSVDQLIGGEEATALLKGATKFNPDPLPANRHAVVLLSVFYIGDDEGPVTVDPTDFSLIGNGNIRYVQAALVPPAPALGYRLYRGGAVGGWLAFEIQINDTDLSLVYDPADGNEAEVRYLALPIPDPATTTPGAAETETAAENLTPAGTPVAVSVPGAPGIALDLVLSACGRGPRVTSAP